MGLLDQLISQVGQSLGTGATNSSVPHADVVTLLGTGNRMLKNMLGQ